MLKFLAFVGVWGSVAVSTLWTYEAAKADDLHPLFLTFVWTWIGFVTAVAIHEAGHYLAARWQGMTVLRIDYFVWQIEIRRNGWKGRERPCPAPYVAAVTVVPDAHRSVRGPMLWVLAAGVLANGVSALALLLATPFVSPNTANVCIAFAWIHFGLGIGSLLPYRGTWDTDALQWLAWWRADLLQHPALARLRLLMASVAGVTADRANSADVAQLDSSDPAAAVLKLWIAMKACQNRGEWPQAAEAGRSLKACIAAVPATMTKQFAEIRWLAEAELAFSTALAESSVEPLRKLVVDRAADWSCPHLWPRCQALIAAFAGDTVTRDRLLAESQRHAENSLDRALGVSEVVMREAVLGV